MRVVLPLLMLLGVAACSREPAASNGAHTKPAAATIAVPVDEDSVAAVLQSPGSPAVSLRFMFEGKPAVGKPAPLRLDLAGQPGVLSLLLQGEGLLIDPSAAMVTLAAGKPASQTFTVTPRSAGIGEIVVRIQPPGDGAAEVVYAIPLLVEAESK